MNEIQINLAGYTYQQDRATHLTGAVTTTTSPITSPTVLSLGSTENLGKGIIEIDEELMWVDSFDRVANTATVAPYGRGYLGTASTTHTAETKVTISPTFPRHVIKRAVNDAIKAMGATIFAVNNTSFTYNSAITTYAFANLNIDNILTIMWQEIGPSKEWIPVRRWSFDSFAEPTAFGYTSTDDVQTVTIGDYITPGRTVKIVYATEPIAFTTNAQVFTTQTGLPESCKDVVVLGASYRLLTYLDPARAAQVSPQADETDSKRPYGSSQNSSRQLLALYTQRLSEETSKQQAQYPIRIHYSR
jgi:hypothetical protein